MTTPAGWYPDTANPGIERYWNGTEWTEQARSLQSAGVTPPPPMTASATVPAAGGGGVMGWVKRHKVWSAIIATLFVFGLIGSLFGEDAKTPASDDTPQAVSTTEAPSPTPTKSKNPENNSDNRLACTSFRREIGPVGEAFTNLGKGTVTVSDVLPVVKKAQEKIGDAASFSHTRLQTTLAALSDDLGRARVALANDDSDALAAVAPQLSKETAEARAICTSIGE